MGPELLPHIARAAMIDPLDWNDGAVFDLKPSQPSWEDAAPCVVVRGTTVEWKRHPVRMTANHDLAVSIDPVDDALLKFALLALERSRGAPLPEHVSQPVAEAGRSSGEEIHGITQNIRLMPMHDE